MSTYLSLTTIIQLRPSLIDSHQLEMIVHMVKLYFLTLFISGWLSCGGYSTTAWDYLVFTQAWPVTFCINNAAGRTDSTESCKIPSNALEWTIHGLWPNRFDGNNPSFCNKSVPFDENKIEDIKSRLKEVWPNLLSDQMQDSLWRHEWEKHGTCALDFEPLNDERKYFKKCLVLYSKYNMTSLLPSLRILPKKSKEYSVIHIFNLLRKAFLKSPYIECVQKKADEPHYLSEIRLCFDKGFQLIDCIPQHGHHGTYLTNCPTESIIIYP